MWPQKRGGVCRDTHNEWKAHPRPHPHPHPRPHTPSTRCRQLNCARSPLLNPRLRPPCWMCVSAHDHNPPLWPWRTTPSLSLSLSSPFATPFPRLPLNETWQSAKQIVTINAENCVPSGHWRLGQQQKKPYTTLSPTRRASAAGNRFLRRSQPTSGSGLGVL